jgi:sporulation protein YunB
MSLINLFFFVVDNDLITYILMMKKKIGIFVFILIFAITMSIVIVNIISNRVTPIVMDYSISEMKRVASVIINRSVNSDLLNNIDMDKLFIVTRGSNDEVVTVTLDSVIVSKITDDISDVCEDNIRLIEEGNFQELKSKFNIGEDFFLVPSGIIFHNTFLNNIGPKIPISLKMIGNVTSGITTEIKEYGINNSLVTISVEIKVELMVILPFSTDYVSITNEVPIAIKLIQGKVPQFYGGSLIN